MGLFSSLFGSGTAKTTSASTPWQSSQLNFGFDQAKDLYQQSQASGPYQGSLYAGANGQQQAAAGYLGSYNLGTGANLAQGVGQTGQALQGATGSYLQGAQTLAGGGLYQPNSGYQGVLSGYAGGGSLSPYGVSQGTLDGMTSAGSQAIGGLSQGQGIANQVSQQAMSDPTQRIASNAASYINNDTINGQIDAVNRDVGRQLSEETLPGLNMQATAGGNLNSSRAGMAEAIATRGAQDRMADNAATIRSNAYNTALSTASGLYTSGLNTALSGAQGLTSGASVGAGLLNGANSTAEGIRQFDTSSRLGAATSGLSSDLGYASLDQSGRIAGTGALGNATNSGVSAAQAGLAMGNMAGQGAYQGGLYGQQDAQGYLDANYQSWLNGQNYGWGNLNNYMGVVGQNYGSTTTGTQSQNKGILGQIAGVASTAAGAYGKIMGGGVAGAVTRNLPQANFVRSTDAGLYG